MLELTTDQLYSLTTNHDITLSKLNIKITNEPKLSDEEVVLLSIFFINKNKPLPISTFNKFYAPLFDNQNLFEIQLKLIFKKIIYFTNGYLHLGNQLFKRNLTLFKDEINQASFANLNIENINVLKHSIELYNFQLDEMQMNYVLNNCDLKYLANVTSNFNSILNRLYNANALYRKRQRKNSYLELLKILQSFDKNELLSNQINNYLDTFKTSIRKKFGLTKKDIEKRTFPPHINKHKFINKMSVVKENQSIFIIFSILKLFCKKIINFLIYIKLIITNESSRNDTERFRHNFLSSINSLIALSFTIFSFVDKFLKENNLEANSYTISRAEYLTLISILNECDNEYFHLNNNINSESFYKRNIRPIIVSLIDEYEDRIRLLQASLIKIDDIKVITELYNSNNYFLLFNNSNQSNYPLNIHQATKINEPYWKI